MWPNWAIYWTLWNFSKPLATINLPKSPTFLDNFWKGVKNYHFSSEIIFGQLLYTFGDNFLVTLSISHLLTLSPPLLQAPICTSFTHTLSHTHTLSLSLSLSLTHSITCARAAWKWSSNQSPLLSATPWNTNPNTFQHKRGHNCPDPVSWLHVLFIDLLAYKSVSPFDNRLGQLTS